MDNRTLLDLSDEEFKTLIDNYAERGADDFMPPSLFRCAS